MKSVLKIILLLTLTVFAGRSYAQESDVHCLPIQESRVIHAMAYQKLLQDTLINELSGKVELLESERITIYRDYEDLLQSERNKTSIAQQISQQHEKVSESLERENHELTKQNRSLRFQRTGAVILGVMLAGIAVVN